MQAVPPLDSNGTHQHVSPPLSHGKQEFESDDGNAMHSGDENDPEDDLDEPDIARIGKRKRPISVSYVLPSARYLPTPPPAYTPKPPNPCLSLFSYLMSPDPSVVALWVPPGIASNDTWACRQNRCKETHRIQLLHGSISPMTPILPTTSQKRRGLLTSSSSPDVSCVNRGR